MIRLLILLTFFFSLNLWANRKSPTSKTGIEGGVDFRLLKKMDRYLFLVESKNRFELLDQNYRQFLLGSYYRLTKRFRTGVFFQSEQGLRWDDDWNKISSAVLLKNTPSIVCSI